MSDHGWRHLFVSREKELAWLQAAWREAKAGRPQFLVLLGESGLGKTRLVQEFYRWLSREEDPGTPACPEGYWPDAFATEARSLDVNPEFPAGRAGPTPPIPWLWWGLRWAIPDRRNEIATGCALIDFRANLETHIRPILAARKLEEVRHGAVWKIASVVSTFIGPLSPLGWITAARDLRSVVIDDRRAERELNRARVANPAEAAEADRRELETQVLETFRLILDPTNSQAPTVPVILVLDDAQWADPVTLRFVDELLRAARTGKWALLVIATHWEVEWKANIRDAPAPDGRLTQLAALPQRHRLGETWKGATVVSPIADLSAVVAAALPGVTQAQLDLILAKAGGNPRLLEEILRHLIDHPQFFDGRDTTRPLTKRAEQQVREESFDYHKLVDERFRRLDDHVRRALGWSSAQGMRFLASITDAIARRVAPEFDPVRLRPALETAEDPHSLIQLFRDQGRFNLGEFRQAAFQHVAKENLGFDENELMAVESALREVLAAWLRGEPDYSGTDGLEPAECRDALAMCLRVFTPEQAETRGPWAIAMAQLAYIHASEYLWKQAHRLARDLADAAPGGWPLGQLPGFWQYEIISLLLRMRDLRRAHRVAASYVAQRVPQSDAPATIEDLRRGSGALTLLGDVELALGERESALAAYRRGLEIRERLLETFGETPEALRDVSLSLDRIGDVELALGERESALSAYRRGLEIRERLLETFGETPEALRDVSLSLDRIGDVELALGERESALSAYRRGLEISERLLETFGETPEALRDVSLSLDRIGDVELALGERESALSAYRRGLEIRERLLETFGETPEALRDVSLSLDRIGDVELALGERESALSAYRRGLEIRERLLETFGETPEALRDVSLSLDRIGDVELALGERESALSAYRRGLEIRERLLETFGETPEALRDVSLSLDRIGDVELALGERESALAAYRRGLEISERLLETFGETPEALRDVSVSLNKVGDAERALGERESALAAYRRGLEISERLLETFGETPEALRDVSVSLNKVGDVERALGERESALAAYRRGLEIRERLLETFGETPEALRDVSVSLDRIGNIEIAIGERESALAAYRRALEISERLLETFGETPEALRDVSVSLDRIGNIEIAIGERESALAAYRRALEISERLLETFGETPEALRDLMISHIRLALLSDKSEAIDRLIRARALTDKIISRGWGVPQTQEDRAWIDAELRRLGDVAED